VPPTADRSHLSLVERCGDARAPNHSTKTTFSNISTRSNSRLHIGVLGSITSAFGRRRNIKSAHQQNHRCAQKGAGQQKVGPRFQGFPPALHSNVKQHDGENGFSRQHPGPGLPRRAAPRGAIVKAQRLLFQPPRQINASPAVRRAKKSPAWYRIPATR